LWPEAVPDANSDYISQWQRKEITECSAVKQTKADEVVISLKYVYIRLQ